MALIKCPECGREVSTSADACPHCGYSIVNNKVAVEKAIAEKTKEVSSWSKPKDQAWIHWWEKKARNLKVKWCLILLACIVGVIISAYLLANDKEVIHNSWGDSYYSKPIYMYFTAIFSWLTVIPLSIWIASLIACRVTTRQYDGYTILLYNGFKRYLVVENIVQDSGVFNRYLSGFLPNKKQVWATLSVWDNSVKFEVGNAGTEKYRI